LNENLRRALLRARLSDEDVAARLEVDPKTVRRWLEGRVPYLRHRWALATMLDLDEADLWPQMRRAQSWPDEVRAIYPHCDALPRELWQDLFRSAEREIGILTDSELFRAEHLRILAVLRERARSGVRVRICLPDPNWPRAGGIVTHTQDAVVAYGKLRESGGVEVRLHRIALNNSIYRADDELLIGQRAFGVPVQQSPVLQLHRTGGDLVPTYLESFDRIWTGAGPSARIKDK
jgi:transcriptional regulator with XRE-family HTH domain